MSGFGHSHSMFCLVLWACGLEFARPRALLSTCLVVCMQFVFLSAACIHVISCAVWHAACVFNCLCAFVLSWLVWTRLMSILISCVFVSCFAHGFCLSFLCAMCSHVNCLDPTHLVSWLLLNLPHLCPLVTLLICSLYNLLVFAVLCQFVITCVLFSFVLSSLVQPCPVQPCQAWLPACFPLRGSCW